ncbi:Sir2 family NAD-dependent protein deacetylase [Alicyclobacillus sp. SO9]|uniref:SIR2 family NAD-dependent protein deacylase n=1 Tax=Alicyclobacillus sp. SO9 TaxID=2665646 RepID=UPI0018E88D71|nr:Sir2 family NAD-dependent protein deacetylase [Alicyclobacillus sp. SO9]QQE76895.1 iron dicitrate transport regulator FecR [Alicyclobacillus sp. SO9]
MTDVYISKNNYQSYLHPVRQLVSESRFITAITGAGISAASGLPLLGDTVQGVELRHFFQAELLNSNPVQYYRVYKEVLEKWRRAKPNAAHSVLARAGVWVITQNIDGLHRDAGTPHLIELHGNLRELRCGHCSLIFSSDMAHDTPVPVCPECSSVLHPGITLEGEEVRHFSRGMDWVGRSELVLIVGTKLEMYPVKDFLNEVRKNNTPCVVINESGENILPELFSRETF